MSIKLPFKLQLNAPVSKMLKNQQDSQHSQKQIILALNRVYKQRLRNSFMSIKNQQLESPSSYFKMILASIKTSNKNSRISYPTYHPTQLPNQNQVPKTPIFNLRVKSIKNQAFFKLKQFFLDVKSYQVSTVFENRQSQLLNHLIAKIQEKVYILAFRAIMDFGRVKKQKSKIVKLLNKFQKNVIKRCYFSEFLNRLKILKEKKIKIKLSCGKISKITKLSERLVIQSAFRKFEVYQKCLRVENKLAQKKERICKIHDINAERTVMIQKERENLRNLKYKLDQQSIEKNHVVTQKRRSLMVRRAKFGEESKQLTDQIMTYSAEVYKLSMIHQKESYIISTLELAKNSVEELKQRGIDFESITLTIYKGIDDLGEEGLKAFYQLVRYHQQKWNHVEYLISLDNVVNQRDYKCRKIALLQKVIRSHESRQPQSQLNSSRFKQLGSSLSTSQLKSSPTTSSFKDSRVINRSYVAKSKPLADPVELTSLKEEYTTLQNFIAFILTKSYQIKIKDAIAAEIELLSELLANDLKENQK